MQSPELEPVVKSVPEIIKQASQSQLGILALLIIVLFGLAFYFFRTAPVRWRGIIFFVFFGGVAGYAWEINRIASKPEAVHYTGRVLDEGTSVPIHEASITVALANKYNPPYRSDSDGNFSFWLSRRKPTDDATVRVEHDAYREYDRTVSSDADTKLGDIRLVPLSASEAPPPPPPSSPTSQPEGSVGSAGKASSDVVVKEEKREIDANRPPAGHAVNAPRGEFDKFDKKVSSVPAKNKFDLNEPSQTALTGSSARSPRIVESSSGPKLSGKGKEWSPWYEVRIGAAPADYTIKKAEFWLSGDRSCGAWAECTEATKNDNEVIWKFRVQGHDEWGAPPQAYSEGHLRVTYARK